MLWLVWLILGLAIMLFGGCALTLYIALKEVRNHDDAEFANTLSGEMAQYKDIILNAQKENAQLQVETYTLKSFDGLTLYADLYAAEPGSFKGSILLAHGFRGSGRSDFSCVVEMYHNYGFDILLIDQRAQGRSEGKRMGLGVLERHDIVRWAHFLAQRKPGMPIILSGVSMGATSVMMAADLDLPEEVRGIVADCGFTSPEEIILWLVRRLHLPEKLMMPALRMVAKPVLGYGLRDCSTIDILAKSQYPLLLVHGEADDFVPCYMSKQNFEAAVAADKHLSIVPKATHGLSFLVDNKGCCERLFSFLERVLS